MTYSCQNQLGAFSLAELASVRLPFGLGIERDLSFQTPFRLSVWSAWSRRAGSILLAESLLNRAVADPEIPTADPGGG